ncbi:MAG TPA: bacillithiol biosynthesis cysteine-adding enzyme BshC [Bacillota bacterium]|jgi:bacillithiol biosynthesis cysteine-adding enzyme BshC
MSLRLAHEPAAPDDPLIQRYLHDFERVASFYRYDPRSAESMAERLEFVTATYDRDRRRLVETLTDYNRRLGAPGETLEQIGHLLRPDSVVVVGGQQAGILTGPLYTVYKAITVIQLAGRLQTELGCPVVPVFWVASEDHDFAEIDHLDIPADEVRRLHLEPPAGAGERRPIGALPVGPEVHRFIDLLDQTAPPSEFKGPILGGVRESMAAGGSLADFFGRLMLRLFGHHGLVLVDPRLGGLRAMQSGFFRTVLGLTGEINEAVEAAGRALDRDGYPRQVEKEATHAHLFIDVDGERLPLFREGPGDDGPRGAAAAGGSTFVARRGRDPIRRYSVAELKATAGDDPGLFSTDVITRPVAQDHLLPVLSSVDGPGEIAYLAQVKGVYPLFGLEMPVIFPRVSVTLVERGVAKILEKYDLSPLDLAGDPRVRLEDFLRSLDRVGVEAAVGHLRGEIADRYRRCWETLAAVDRSLPGLGKKNLQRVLDELGWFERRAVEARNRAAEDAARQFAKAALSLFPGGHRQERVFNVYPYLFKYGEGLIGQLMALPLLAGNGLRLVYIE